MNVIECPRLNLRRLGPHDAHFMLKLLNERGFLRFIGDKGVRTLEDAREYISKGPMDSYRRHGFGLYHVSLRACGTPIGICGLVRRETLPDVDVGFAFLEEYWGAGYATESAAAVLDHARQTLGIGRIVAIISPDNHGSIAVVGKIGLNFEGRIRLSDEGLELNLYGPGA